MKAAFAALDLKAVAAIGRSPHHPLRVVATADPRLEVKRQQQMSAETIGIQAEWWAPPLIADRIAEEVLAAARVDGKWARGAWVEYRAPEFDRLVLSAARALGIQMMSLADYTAAAERWALRRWG